MNANIMITIGKQNREKAIVAVEQFAEVVAVQEGYIVDAVYIHTTRPVKDVLTAVRRQFSPYTALDVEPIISIVH